MPNSPRRRGCGGRARIRGSQTDGTRPPRSCWRCSSSVVQAHASADAQWGSWRGLKACISGPSATSGVLAPLCLHFTFPSCCTCIRRTPLATHSPSPTSLAAMAAPPVCRHVAFSCNLARQRIASHRIARSAVTERAIETWETWKPVIFARSATPSAPETQNPPSGHFRLSRFCSLRRLSKKRGHPKKEDRHRGRADKARQKQKSAIKAALQHRSTRRSPTML